MDLETEVKPKFVNNYKDPRVWFLTDLEKGTIYEAPELLLYAKYGKVHCGN